MSKPPRITKAQVATFRKRWKFVNEREAEELRTTPVEIKFKQFSTLLEWAHRFGWADALREGEMEVRERWAKLRKAYLASKK